MLIPRAPLLCGLALVAALASAHATDDEFADHGVSFEHDAPHNAHRQLKALRPFTNWDTTVDAIQYIVAFLMVLLAAHPLGVMFPRYLKLPLITGYLIVGIVAGPFAANLLPTQLVSMLSPFVSALALSFISFQAGQEIYLPELRPQIRSILILMLVLYIVTMVVLTIVLMLANNAFFYDKFEGACQLAIGLMFGSIAVLGSPATVMAIKIEQNSVGPFTNLMLGATMTAEFVVLVSFSVSRVISSIHCANISMSVGNLMFTLGIVFSNLVVGGIISLFIIAIFSIPGGPEHSEETAELLVDQDRVSHQGATTSTAQQYIMRSRRNSLRKPGMERSKSVRGDLESAMSPINEHPDDALPHPHNAYYEADDEDENKTPRRSLCELFLEGIGSLYAKGFIWLLMGYAFYISTDTISEAVVAAYGHKWDIKFEPLLVLMTASCLAGHYSSIRHDMHVILDTAAPYIFLPFFVMTGANLKLDQVVDAIPLMSTYVILRFVSIFIASYVGARFILKLTPREYNNLWLTLTPQAGVALGLASEIKGLSTEKWADEFSSTIVAAVVINQIIGPVLCAIGLRRAGESYASRVEKAMAENAANGNGDVAIAHSGSVASVKIEGEINVQNNGDPRPLLPFYKVHNAVVIGEDETAFEVALELSLYGAHVNVPLLDEELATKWHQINETILARSAKGELIKYKNKLQDHTSADAALTNMNAATDVVIFTGDPQRSLEHIKTMHATLGRTACPRLIAIIPNCTYAQQLKDLNVLIIQPSIAMANIATRMALLDRDLAQQLSNEISTTSNFSTATYFMRHDDDNVSVHSLSEMRLMGRRLALGRSVVNHHNVNYDQVAEALAAANLPLPPPPARVSMFGTSAPGHDPFTARGGRSVYEHYVVEDADIDDDYGPGEVFTEQFLSSPSGSESEQFARGRARRRSRRFSSRTLRRSRSSSANATVPLTRQHSARM